MCKEGIRFFKQEESYTSKASFLDKDPVPVWSKDVRRNIALAQTNYAWSVSK